LKKPVHKEFWHNF